MQAILDVLFTLRKHKAIYSIQFELYLQCNTPLQAHNYCTVIASRIGAINVHSFNHVLVKLERKVFVWICNNLISRFTHPLIGYGLLKINAPTTVQSDKNVSHKMRVVIDFTHSMLMIGINIGDFIASLSN